MSLTPKQRQLLDFIQFYQLERGVIPSQQEIAAHFGFRSLGTVQDYLNRLQAAGHLQRRWNSKRGVQLAAPTFAALPSATLLPLPLLGRVAAGKPIEALGGGTTLAVPASMLKRGGEHFVLQVQGDSM